MSLTAFDATTPPAPEPRLDDPSPSPSPVEDFDGAWAATAVEVTSPNEQVGFRMYDDRKVRVWFAPGYPARASRSEVTQQLGRLARLALAERTRRFFELRSVETGRVMRPDRRLVTPANREYAARAAELVASGRSRDGRVTVVVTGMRDFSVVLGPGWRELGEQGLALGVSEAAEATLAEHAEQTSQLRERIYYPG